MGSSFWISRRSRVEYRDSIEGGSSMATRRGTKGSAAKDGRKGSTSTAPSARAVPKAKPTSKRASSNPVARPVAAATTHGRKRDASKKAARRSHAARKPTKAPSLLGYASPFGDPVPLPPTRFRCPESGCTTSFSRTQVGQRVPPCPIHNVALVRTE